MTISKIKRFFIKPLPYIIRLALGISLGLTLIASAPIYNEPFFGCSEGRLLTLTSGCTLWMEFTIGMCAVFLISLIGPRELKPHIWGCAVVFILALMGGFPGIKSGVHIDIILNPSSIIHYWLGSSGYMAAGGILAASILHLLQKSKNNNSHIK